MCMLITLIFQTWENDELYAMISRYTMVIDTALRFLNINEISNKWCNLELDIHMQNFLICKDLYYVRIKHLSSSQLCISIQSIIWQYAIEIFWQTIKRFLCNNVTYISITRNIYKFSICLESSINSYLIQRLKKIFSGIIRYFYEKFHLSLSSYFSIILNWY